MMILWCAELANKLYAMWLIGAALNVIGSVLVNFGTNIIKYSHNLKSKEAVRSSSILAGSSSSQGVYTPSSIWRTGIAFLALGSSINFASFAFAAQSLLAALSGVQFISNVIFYRFVLKEKLTSRIALATLFLIAGLACAVSYSNHNDDVHTSIQLIHLYDAKYFICMSFITGSLTLSELVYHIYSNRESSGAPLPYSKYVRPLTYSFVSATIGSQSVLQSKCIAEILKATFKNKYQGQDIGVNSLLEDWFSYITITLFVTGSAFWLYRLNKALKLFDGVLIIPLLQAFWTVMAIIQGGLYFKEFDNYSAKQYFGFIVGIALLLCGVCLLAPTSPMKSTSNSMMGATFPNVGDAATKSRPLSDVTKNRDATYILLSSTSALNDIESTVNISPVCSSEALGVDMTSSDINSDSDSMSGSSRNEENGQDAESFSDILRSPGMRSWTASFGDYLLISSSMPSALEDRRPLLFDDHKATSGVVDLDSDIYSSGGAVVDKYGSDVNISVINDVSVSPECGGTSDRVETRLDEPGNDDLFALKE